VDALRAPIRRCLSGEADLERLTVPAVTRRGRTVDCGVTITPLRAEGQVTGVVLVMEAEDARTEPT
jgi:two-component system CheB/CheR fusion protein